MESVENLKGTTMGDDIVDRLLNIASEHDLCWEAAGEIKRLREEINAWMGVAERFAESDPRFDAYLHYFKLRFKGNNRG